MSVKYKDQSISGAPGKDATINGQNTLEIVAGENVTIDQKDAVITINATGGGSAGEIYSTEETRIGTWIDGKPLYRIVISGVFPTIPSNNQKWIRLYDFPSIDVLINIEVIMRYSDDQQNMLLKGMYAMFDYYHATNSVRVLTPDGSFSNKPFTSIIEYTKTTD